MVKNSMNRFRNQPIAKKFRKQMSPPEVILWLRLRKRVEGHPNWRRQYAYENYIFDFYCPALHIIIEIDGQGRIMGDNPIKDEKRDEFLKSRGFEIHRICAKDVLDRPDEVGDNIRNYAFRKYNAQ